MQPLNRPWRRTLHLGESVSIAKGDVVPCRPDTVAYLESGLLRLARTRENGEEKTLTFLTADNLFQEIPYLTRLDMQCDRFVVRALEPSRVVFLDKHDVDSLLAGHPELMYNLLESTSYKVGLFTRRAIQEESDLRRRLCNLLFDLAAYNGFAHTLKPRITQKDVADILEVHRCTLSRAISDLRSEGIISKFTKNTLVIEDMQALMDAAGVVLPAVDSPDYAPLNWHNTPMM